jgi:hypothetical protein
MARIVERIAGGAVDTKTVREELKYTHPGEFETALRILLARRGDRSQSAPLAAFLAENRPFPWLRDQALTALEPFRDRGLTEAIWKVGAHDPYYVAEARVSDPQGKRPPGPGLVYPVRKHALEVLRRWKDAGVPMSSYVLRDIDANRYQFVLPPRKSPGAPR